MSPQDIVNQLFTGAAGSSIVGEKSVGQMNPTAVKTPSFGSQVAHTIATAVPAVASAIGHGVSDSFTSLASNAANSLAQGPNSALDQRRQALDKQTQALFKAYSNKTISKAQFTAASKTQMAQIQGLQKETQTNINNVKSTSQMLPAAAQAIGTVLTLGGGGLAEGGAEGLLAKAGDAMAGSRGAKVAGTVGKAVDDTIGTGKNLDKNLGKNIVTQLPGKIVHNLAVTQPTIQFAGQAVNNAKKGNLQGLAGDVALAAAPAALGVVAKGAKAVLPILNDAMHGVPATITDALGVKRVQTFMKTATPEQINSLKRMEMFTEDQPAVKAGSVKPGDKLAEHLQSIGVDPKNAPIADIVNHFDTYAQAHGALEDAKAGNAAAITSALSENKQAKAEASATNKMAEASASPTSTPPKLSIGDKEKWEAAFGTPPPEPKVSEPVPTVKPNLTKVPDAIHPDAVVSADFRKAIPAAVGELSKLGENPSPEEKITAVNRALGQLGNVNQTVKTKIGAALTDMGSGSEMAKNIGPIIQKNIIDHPDINLPEGFIATQGPSERAVLPSISEADKAGMPVIGADPKGIMGKIGAGLKNVGMGLETTPSSTTQKAITQNLGKRLIGTPYEGKESQIMGALHEATSKTQGIFDPRLLRAATGSVVGGGVNVTDELSHLGVNEADAKMILKQVKGAYGDVPLGTRSLGEKITDKTIQHVPGMAPFLKVQGYAKFSLNPFFMAKQAIKSEFIGQTETGGKAINAGRYLNKLAGTAPKEDTMNLIRGEGYTAKGNAAGSEGDFLGDTAPGAVGKVSGQQVRGYIQNSMGQAAEQFAKNNGTTVKDILKPADGEQHPLKPELDNLMQMIVGYPKGSNPLNSNLAKSLNVLVFPSRFEAKVGMATAKYFTSQPKVVQLALINGALKASAWASSPTGQKWQKDNADALGIINYFSPTHTVSEVMNFLHSGQIADLGQVGGLPFGVITTILKNQGVALPGQLTGSDTNPATGEDYVQKLPTTDKARLQQGIADLIGQMFSYPGATLGLPSKTSEVQSIPGLKPSAKEQKTVGGTTPSATQLPALKSFKPTSFSSMHSPTPTISPIYKGNEAKAPKAKTLARRPAN